MNKTKSTWKTIRETSEKWITTIVEGRIQGKTMEVIYRVVYTYAITIDTRFVDNFFTFKMYSFDRIIVESYRHYFYKPINYLKKK